MTPDATGRYCNSCQKSVIDFTEKTDEEIQQILINNFNQPLCGRFKNTQIQRIVINLPQNILSIKMPLWMRFLVACLLIFSISIFPFKTTIAGKIPQEASFYQGKPIAGKTEKKSRIFKKKKKIKFRMSGDILRGIETMSVHTMGYMSNISTPISKTIFDSFLKVNYETSIQPRTGNSTLPHKEQPGPTPFIPTEFILPSILLFKKENNNQTMD